jgi:hypothetical protein
VESFVLADFQCGNSFAAKYGGSGLLFWHVLRDITGAYLSWDLESAVGKFTGGNPDPASGKDPLEQSAAHLGSGADFFVDTANCACGTNPSTALYSGAAYTSAQSVKSSIALESIREDANGDVLLDFFVTPRQRITHPVGGETLAQSLADTIRWSVREHTCIDSVLVLLSDDGGASFDTLDIDTENVGSFVWTPSQTGSLYIARILSHDEADNSAFSESDTFAVTDQTVPGGVDDLAIDFEGNTGIVLSFTAPGDDGAVGTALQYDLRRHTSAINSGNWASATQVTGEPNPSVAGTLEFVTASGLEECHTYHFALRARDEAGNWSVVSNSVVGATLCCQYPCEIPPALTPEDQTAAIAPRPPSAQSASAGGSSGRVVIEFEASEAALEGVLFFDGATGAGLPAGIHVQTPDGSGGRQSSGPFHVGNRVGVRAPRDAERRVVLVGDYGLEGISGATGSFTLEALSNSRLGDVFSVTQHSSALAPEFQSGDTLTFRFEPSAGPLPGAPSYLLVAGSAGNLPTAARGSRFPSPALPREFALAQNRPNPFSNATTLRFDLPRAERVRLEVFDLQGRRVATLANGDWPAGSHAIEWTRRSSTGVPVQPGVYVYTIEAGAFRAQRKMVLLP